jgi:hypothetical protein
VLAIPVRRRACSSDWLTAWALCSAPPSTLTRGSGCAALSSNERRAWRNRYGVARAVTALDPTTHLFRKPRPKPPFYPLFRLSRPSPGCGNKRGHQCPGACEGERLSVRIAGRGHPPPSSRESDREFWRGKNFWCAYPGSRSGAPANRRHCWTARRHSHEGSRHFLRYDVLLRSRPSIRFW